MRRNRTGEREDDEILDDILPFKRWDEESTPGHRREKNEWEERQDEMRNEKRDHKPLHLWDEEEDANKHFVKPKQENKPLKRHGRQRARKKVPHDRICRTHIGELQRAEPKIDDEKRKPRERHIDPAQRRDEGAIRVADEWEHREHDSKQSCLMEPIVAFSPRELY